MIKINTLRLQLSVEKAIVWTEKI